MAHNSFTKSGPSVVVLSAPSVAILSAPLVAVLVPRLSLIAAVLKILTLL